MDTTNTSEAQISPRVIQATPAALQSALKPTSAGTAQSLATRSHVEQALYSAQCHLLAMQEPAGFYLYSYNPLDERTIAGPANLVRQAGCAYALAQSAEHTRDADHARELTLSAIRAITFLLASAAPLPDGGIYLPEPDHKHYGKLGTIALSLLALQGSMLRQSYEFQRQQLLTAILHLQETSGAFRCSTDSPSAVQNDSRQNFFPGEALLALCQEASAGSQASLTAVERAFSWYRDYFRRYPTTAFVCWQADVWSRFFILCAQTKKSRLKNSIVYACFVFEMIDWLLQFQVQSEVCHPDFTGGFAHAGKKPNVATAANTEAVLRASGLAAQIGESERAQRYRRAALKGLAFLFQLQIQPTTSQHFPNPTRAIGGIRQDLDNFTIRCDYDQHAITAFLAALETPDLFESN